MDEAAAAAARLSPPAHIETNSTVTSQNVAAVAIAPKTEPDPAPASDGNKVSSASSTSSLTSSKLNLPSGNDTDASEEDQKLPPAAYYKIGGRIRLPDKLMEYLSKKVLPDTLWWQPDGDGFAFNTDNIQTDFLDKHFRGTKLTSFIRSLNRW